MYSQLERTAEPSRFRIISKIGDGGMGTVYRAMDEYTGRLCALKVMKVQGKQRAADLERFWREAEILCELRCQGIVSYVAHGYNEKGAPYLAMEWLEGEDLAHRLTRGPLSVEDSLTILRRVADALAAAHARGIVHRDIKPSNIFLRNGLAAGATLLDFGIARWSCHHHKLTETGVTVGTTAYMSPEQVSAVPDIGPATDIFSLGIVLFESLTGQLPFGEDEGARFRIYFQPAPKLAQYLPVPLALEDLLARMLTKDVAQRPHDGAALSVLLPELSLDAIGLPEAAPTRSSTLSPREQRLLCVLMARGDSGLCSPNRMEDLSAATTAESPIAAVISELSRQGARADLLGDGTLVAALERMESARDQAVVAARCSLLVKKQWPGVNVVLATGGGLAGDHIPIGEAINRATRMLQEPPPPERMVRIDSLTAGLLRGRFAVIDDPSGSLLTDEALSEEQPPSLLGRPAPYVGRRLELDILKHRLEVCIDEGQASAVVVSAPPGMGKSRLRYEFLRWQSARDKPAAVFVGYGDPLTKDSPFSLLGQALRRYSGILLGEDGECQRKKLRERIGLHLPQTEQRRIIDFLGELSGIPPGEDSEPRLRAARNDPKVMSDQISFAFIDWLRALCTRHSVLFVLEDLQWADHLSVALLDQALQALRNQPAMVLGLARPEVQERFPQLWGHCAQHLGLQRLSHRSCTELIRKVLGAELDDERVVQLIERADGNPLFLEELIREVALGASERLPETVRAMLVARFSRLAPEQRRVLRMASIFGETFWPGGVAKLCEQSQDCTWLEPCLESLIAQEVVERQRTSRFPGEAEYKFRHALFRDAVYDLLAESDRVLGHRLAASFLRGAGESDDAVLAEHHERGGEMQAALPHFLRAAERAVQNHHLKAALEYIERGLACGADGEARGTLLGLRCAVQVWSDKWEAAYQAGAEAIHLLQPGSWAWCKLMGHLFVLTFASAERQEFSAPLIRTFVATEPYADARAAYIEALSWLLITFSSCCQTQIANGFLARVRAVADDILAPDPASQAWLRFGETTYSRMLERDPWRNLLLAEQAAKAFAAAGDRRNQSQAESYVGLAQHELGDPLSAEVTLRGALARAHELGERLQIHCASAYLAIILADQGNPAALEQARSLARSVIEKGDANFFFSGQAHSALARAALCAGKEEEAEREARVALTLLAPTPTAHQHARVTLIRALLRQRKISAALAVAQPSLEQADAVGGYQEIAVRLAAAAASLNAGAAERPRAKEILGAAIESLQRRGAAISDSGWKSRYLKTSPDALEAKALYRNLFGAPLASL